MQRFLIPVFLVFVLVGCVAKELTPAQWKDPAFSLVWPPPPLQPRIELLRVVSAESGLAKGQEKKNRLLRWLIGDAGDSQPLISPYGIAADGQGKVWIADPGSSLVHVFNISQNEVEYIALAGKSQLISPVDVVYEPTSDRLYVSDSGLGEVFIYKESGEYVGPLTVDWRFHRPAGMAVDRSGNLYVVDVLGGRIEVFDPAGRHLRSIGSASLSEGLFNRPSNVFVDSFDRLYVVDSLRFRVEIQSPDGELLGTIGQIGDSPGSFARPRGITVDSSGHIYVTDAAFDNIQIFDMAGNLLLHFGVPGSGAGEFCLPAGLSVDDEDRIYVAEACNHRFQIFQYLQGPVN